MKLNRDQITGLFLIFFGLVVGILVSGFRVPFTISYPGPKLLPMIAVVGFIVCGLGIFVTGTRDKETKAIFLVQEGWIRLAISTGLLTVYILGMKFLGYLIMTPLICYCITTLYSKGSNAPRRSRIIYSLCLTGGLYIVYVFAFGLGLPTGQLLG